MWQPPLVDAEGKCLFFGFEQEYKHFLYQLNHPPVNEIRILTGFSFILPFKK